MDIKEWVEKNAVLKDGANIEELETIVKDLNPLENVQDKDQAIDFINRNSLFKSALDSVISKAVDSHDKKFQEEKLPEIIKAEREKLAKELNPEETPEQKKLREMQEKMESLEKERAKDRYLADLAIKSKEIGYKGDIQKFLVYGEKAVDMMKSEYDYIQESIKKREEELSKEFFKGGAPKGGEPDPNVKTIGRAEFNQLSPQDKMAITREKVNIVD